MNWTEMLTQQVEDTYKATEGLINLVDEEKLAWKPMTGDNWMTTAQLLKHIDSACGACFKGFVTGDWGMPEGASSEDMSPEDMLPTADKMPAVASLDEARQELAADKQVALDMLAQAGEDDLASKMVAAPWSPVPLPLGYQLNLMVAHLAQHKAQLFYYLKLQGVPVNTGHLWGM